MSDKSHDNTTPPSPDDATVEVERVREESVTTNVQAGDAAGTTTPPRSVVTVSTETEHESLRRTPLSPAVLAVVAIAVISLIVILAFFLWPRKSVRTATVETPPTMAKKEGEEAGDQHSQEGAIEVSDEMAETVGIKTEPAAKGEIEDTIATTGRVLVAPDAQGIVGAKVEGRAVRVTAEPGQSVRAGQTVVVIDSPQVAELRGQLIEARSKLRLAEQNRTRVARSENRAAAIQAKNKLDLAQSTLERKRRLAGIGVAAQREVQEAETEYKNAKAEYDYQSSIQTTREQQEAVSGVEQARATVARISQSLAALGASDSGQGGTVSVTAPISGTVVDRHVSVGEAVTQGKELMTVMNLSSVIVEAQLPESQAARVRSGQRLIARIPGATDRAFEGFVQSVGETVDPEKRTVPVRARVANMGTTLKHEMAVEVRLVTGGRKDALLIPVSAFVDNEGVKVVYVKEGERYERRVVSLGAVTYQWAEVLSGVEEGEEVVTAGAYQLQNMKKGGGEEGGHDDDH
jgi:cobalt-zinc-cadmium efflux system membrane fusion protein